MPYSGTFSPWENWNIVGWKVKINNDDIIIICFCITIFVLFSFWSTPGSAQSLLLARNCLFCFVALLLFLLLIDTIESVLNSI